MWVATGPSAFASDEEDEDGPSDACFVILWLKERPTELSTGNGGVEGGSVWLDGDPESESASQSRSSDEGDGDRYWYSHDGEMEPCDPQSEGVRYPEEGECVGRPGDNEGLGVKDGGRKLGKVGLGQVPRF